MNYYEHHLGDWAAATGHLTWDEDMAYTRLLRAYYHAEKAIPEGQQYRLAKASTPPQRKAVDQVLAEFFDLEEGFYRQKRADAEIARYQAGEPEREAKKANEEARMKRHREERARLFQALADAGQPAPWNTGMNELREMVKRCGLPLHATAPATAPATPATATHTQSPDTIPKQEVSEAKASSSAEPTLPGMEDPPPGRPSIPCPYGAIVDAYHAALPSLPAVRLRDGPTWKAREKAIRAMWGWVLSSRRPDQTRRAENAEQALAWFGEYFALAAENDFVMGRTRPSAEHANWRADLDYLMSPKGLKQVIEKTQEVAA